MNYPYTLFVLLWPKPIFQDCYAVPSSNSGVDSLNGQQIPSVSYQKEKLLWDNTEQAFFPLSFPVDEPMEAYASSCGLDKKNAASRLSK